MHHKTREINQGHSNIRQCGAWHRRIFAVGLAYFFERPAMMKTKHPEHYTALTELYQQDVTAIASNIKPRKKAPYPCGSRERYKHCCLPKA